MKNLDKTFAWDFSLMRTIRAIPLCSVKHNRNRLFTGKPDEKADFMLVAACSCD